MSSSGNIYWFRKPPTHICRPCLCKLGYKYSWAVFYVMDYEIWTIVQKKNKNMPVAVSDGGPIKSLCNQACLNWKT